jgi:hypothetical protein
MEGSFVAPDWRIPEHSPHLSYPASTVGQPSPVVDRGGLITAEIGTRGCFSSNSE